MLADDLPVAETYYVISDTQRPISSSVHSIEQGIREIGDELCNR